MTDADELVRRYVQRSFRQECKYSQPHLVECPDMIVVVDDAYDGEYGCDTGCEYVRFKATVSCPHQAPTEYEFGEFNDLADIVKDMQRDEERQ